MIGGNLLLLAIAAILLYMNRHLKRCADALQMIAEGEDDE